MDELVVLLKNAVPDVDWINSKTLVSDGEINSLNVVEIISAIEDHYGICIVGEDIDIANFESISRIMRMIEKYLNL